MNIENWPLLCSLQLQHTLATNALYLAMPMQRKFCTFLAPKANVQIVQTISKMTLEDTY